jgi:hypothetical protein
MRKTYSNDQLGQSVLKPRRDFGDLSVRSGIYMRPPPPSAVGAGTGAPPMRNGFRSSDHARLL